MASRLKETRRSWNSPAAVGVNLGKSKVTPLDEAVGDYVESTRQLAEFADYLVINVSSPNTPGLRELQDEGALREIIQGVSEVSGDLPIFVKLAPDLENEALDALVRVAQEENLEGLIATNTTIDHQGIADVGPGGLSGRPLATRSREVVNYLTQRIEKPVIAVGGISSVEDAMAMFEAGASAIQIYSALIFQGPALIAAINQALLKKMNTAGVDSFEALRQRLRQS
jgi:dihydroorotate dehydrogenase